MDVKTIAGLRDRFKSYGRTFYKTATGFLHDFTYGGEIYPDECLKVNAETAMLVGSLCEDGTHAPVLDIDLPAQLVPTTTEGHFHLYIEKKMSWEQYKALLEALFKAGIIQEGFYKMAVKRGQSMVLMPGINRNSITDGPRFVT